MKELMENRTRLIERLGSDAATGLSTQQVQKTRKIFNLHISAKLTHFY